MLSRRERDDQLCADVVRVLERLAVTLEREPVERCLGCGSWVDPAASCATCAGLVAARRDVDSWMHA